MNFDEIIPRKSTNSYKWDSNPETRDLLPMWVADMDFKTAPAVIEALRQRVDHGIFGYTKVPDEYYAAITHWFHHRHDWKINPEHIIYTTGVVPALSASIKGLTDEGDKVIVQSPVYNLFFTSIRNNRCSMLDNRLNALPGQPYEIDFDSLEGLAGEAKLMILCNPHNPVGRIWSADELTRIARICAANDVTVISDEIHCELTYDTPYVPFAPIAEEVGCRYVILNSPSKAFNTAGLQIANIICPDRDMRWKIDRAINDNEVCDVNPFGVVGLIAAYNDGSEWLDELRKYLWENYQTAKRFFEQHLPHYPITPLQATYLLWIDTTTSGIEAETLCKDILSTTGLRVSPGPDYGPGGENHIRLNIACPHSVMVDGLNRLKKVLKSI